MAPMSRATVAASAATTSEPTTSATTGARGSATTRASGSAAGPRRALSDSTAMAPAVALGERLLEARGDEVRAHVLEEDRVRVGPLGRGQQPLRGREVPGVDLLVGGR